MKNTSDDSKPVPRGDATRERLLAVAIDLFGKRGFDGVGAREITRAAEVPLSAIPYYFKTMELLYRASIERVCASLAEALGPASAAAAQAVQASPAKAAEALAVFQAALLGVIAVDTRAEAWAKLLLREHLDPGPAFDLVYDDAARDAIDLMAALIARANGDGTVDERALLQAFGRMGEVLVFRAVRAAAMRRLGWKTLEAAEAGRIAEALWGPAPSRPVPSPRRRR